VGRVILRRVAGAIPVVLLVTLITFGLMRLIPGDISAALGGVSSTPAEREQIRRNLGLDQPAHVQLVKWYAGLLHGDLGRSLFLGKPVTEATFERLPVSLSLSAYALVLTLLLGVVSGVLAALRQNSWVDQAAMMFAMIGISMPNFWLGLMMIVLFSVHLGWLPTGGYIPFEQDPIGWLRTTTMPAISLALLQIGLLARITRSSHWRAVGRHWRLGIPAPKYPAFAAYLAQRSPKGSIFENRTQLCLSERPDPPMRRVVDRPTVAIVPAV